MSAQEPPKAPDDDADDSPRLQPIPLPELLMPLPVPIDLAPLPPHPNDNDMALPLGTAELIIPPEFAGDAGDQDLPALAPVLLAAPSPLGPTPDAPALALTPGAPPVEPTVAAAPPTPLVSAPAAEAEVAVPNLMDDLYAGSATAADVADLILGTPALERADVAGTEQGTNLAPPRVDTPQGGDLAGPPLGLRPQLPRRGLVVGLAAASLAGLGVAGWLLLGRQRSAPDIATSPPPPALAEQEPARAIPPAPLVPVAAPAPPPARVPLRADTVDGLDYASLRAGVAALPADAEPGLRDWARFRLASTFADANARTDLLALLAGPRPGPRTEPLQAAAYVGALLLSGQPARLKQALQPLKGAAARAPQAQRLRLMAQQRRHAMAPARLLAQLDRLLEAAPGQLDVHLWRAELLLARADAKDGLAALAAMPQHDASWIRVRAVELLGAAEAWTPLAEQLAQLQPEEPLLGSLAPAQADALLRLWVRHQARRGDVRAALALTTVRIERALADASTWSELLRLVEITQGDVKATQAAALAALQGEARGAFLHQATAQALRQRRLPEAERLVHELQALPPTERAGWAQLAEGQLQQQQRRPVLARQSFTAAAASHPGWSLPKTALQLLGSAGRPAELRLLQQASRGGQRPDLTLQLANLNEAQGDLAGAAQALERLLWQDPTLDDPVLLQLRWLRLLQQGGETQRVDALLQQLMVVLPEDDRPLLARIDMAQHSRRPEAVLAGRRALLARHPGQRQATLNLVEALIGANQGAEALEALAALVKADPSARDADLIYLEARATATHDPAKARGLLMAAAQAHPDVKIYLALADLEQGRGQVDEAVQALRDAVKLAPDDGAIQLRLARLLLQKGFVRDAVTTLETVLMRSPKHVEAAEALGDALREQGNNLGAVAAYRRALAQAPKQAGLLLKVARIELQELGQVQEALRTLRLAVQLDPKDPEAQYYLGFAMRDSGHAAAARTALRHYLKLAPKGEYANEAQQALDDMP